MSKALQNLLLLYSNIWSRALGWDGTACTECAAMVQATNGADPSRRLAMLGFCRSVSGPLRGRGGCSAELWWQDRAEPDRTEEVQTSNILALQLNSLAWA